MMDADDEPAMAYFLPDGIADDSPPKQSRKRASFGPIGGRTSAAVSGASSLNALPDPTRSRSRLEVSGTSPRPSQYRLSDLGGTIHTPRGARGVKASVAATASARNPLSPFGAGSPDSLANGAGPIRSPTSRFGLKAEPSPSYSLESDRNGSGLYPTRDAQQLYRGAGTSFGSTPRQAWPSVEATEPRRILQRPPGLAGPPGISGMHSMEGRLLHQHERVPDSLQHLSALSTSNAGASALNRGYSQEEALNASRLLSRTMGVYNNSAERAQAVTRGVSDPGYAMLTTQSIRVGKYARNPIDSAASMGDNSLTSPRQKDVHSTLTTRRIPAEAREDILTIESRSDLRAKALEFTLEANKTLILESFTAARPSTPLTVDKLAASYESTFFSADHGEGKWRDASASSSSLYAGGKGRRGRADPRDNAEAGLTAPPGFDPQGRGGEIHVREYGTKNQCEDTKPQSRSPFKGTFTRGNDKTVSRRQIYREKQAKEPAVEQLVSKGSSLIAASPRTAQSSLQKKVASSDGRMSGVGRKKHDTAKSNTLLRHSIGVVSATPKLAIEDADEEVRVHAKRFSDFNPTSTSDQAHGTASSASEEDLDGCSARASASRDPLTGTEHDSLSSSDVHEDEQSVTDESFEGRQEVKADLSESDDGLSRDESSMLDVEQARAVIDQAHASSIKKSKKKALTALESSQSVSKDEADPSHPDQARHVGRAEKKQESTKEHRKEKLKKDKTDKKKGSRGKKDKRGLAGNLKVPDAANDSAAGAQDDVPVPFTLVVGQVLYDGSSVIASIGSDALRGMWRYCCPSGRLSFTGLSTAVFACVRSMLVASCRRTMVFSMHAVSWFIRVHRVAFRAILMHRHIGFCFAFLYGFPFLVQYVFPWAPPWAPVCLWYAFLVQLFCTNGSTAMVTTFRVILPLVFLIEGISHHSFLLDLNGAELLLTSFIISALKINNLCSPIFFLSLATQCLLAVFFGSELIVQWLQLALALYSLYAMAATEDEWFGMGDEDDELSSLHHSIADYNRHQAPPSAASNPKTKSLDRRALAYIRGRKFR